FAYVGGNPLGSVDPLGLMTLESWWNASVAGFQSESLGSAVMRTLEGWPVGASMVGGLGRYVTAFSSAPVTSAAPQVFDAGMCAAKGLGNQNPLYKVAVQQFKATDLSNAGRALTKHPEVIGQTKDTLRQSLRTDGGINDAAHAALRDIMRNGVTTTPTLGRYGTVTQTQVPGGFGARWASDGSFIGFINP
ncbi:MAG: hypothetical protein ACK4OH_19045, partial [Acidovorax temperans]|uniref:hypothetical protein n=1 Tax=Acidovorax temperans TaxID=80878 RepID=UPI00391A2E1B